MKKTAAPQSTSAAKTMQSLQELHIFRELADTTWRIAVPVVAFAGLGIFADLKLGSKPWVTLLGVVIGFVFAGVLVKRQLALSEHNEETHES